MISTLILPLLLASPAPLVPGVRYDDRIPTLKQVVGHELGERITSPEDVSAYLHALAAAAPDRASWSSTRAARRGGRSRCSCWRRRSASRGSTRSRRACGGWPTPAACRPQQAEQLVAELPAVVWLMHAVHGNEISCVDAALALAHHLLAAQDDPVAELVRREALLLIDPLQNPDGRARFVAGYQQSQGPAPDAEPISAEHDEPWPGGRGNHYLFDMNRDWFAQTQPETRGRMRAVPRVPRPRGGRPARDGR